MREGTILLYRAGKGLVQRAITYFTGMPYSHVAGYLGGFTFESTAWWSGLWWKSGIRIEIGLRKADEYWQPKTELTAEQSAMMLRHFIGMVNERRPYNVLKLLVLAIVYPTRKIWDKLKWVPFERDWHGDVCSVVWDEAYGAAGIDLLPYRYNQYTAPGDFRHSPLLEEVK